jgi:hypothetical protein
VASMVQRFQIIWSSTPTSSPRCGNSACIENGQPQRVSSRDGDWSLIHFILRLQASADGRLCTYKTMHAAMIMDAAMIDAFPLMPEHGHLGPCATCRRL